MKILFVCKGNVGRSQFAEALFRKYVPGDHEVISAGTKLSGPEEPLGNIAHIDNVLETMVEEGIDISERYRTQLTEQMFNDADTVIFLLNEDDSIPDFAEHSDKVIRWHVPDPKGTDLAQHKAIKDEIKQRILTEKFDQ